MVPAGEQAGQNAYDWEKRLPMGAAGRPREPPRANRIVLALPGISGYTSPLLRIPVTL